MFWFDKNVHVDDREALAKLVDAPELERVHLTFVPSAREVDYVNQRLLPKHPALELRIHSLHVASLEFLQLCYLPRIEALT